MDGDQQQSAWRAFTPNPAKVVENVLSVVISAALIALGGAVIGLIELTTEQVLLIASVLVAVGVVAWWGRRRWRELAARRAEESGRDLLEWLESMTEEQNVAWHKLTGPNAPNLTDEDRERYHEQLFEGWRKWRGRRD